MQVICAIMMLAFALVVLADLLPLVVMVLVMMMIPTDKEILDLLDELDRRTADDLESEVLDFKPWEGDSNSRKVAVEYAACMANAHGGIIVFGVEDRIVGRANAIRGVGRYDHDVWQRAIFESTSPRLNVTLSEIAVPEGTGRLLVVRVPRGENPPYGTSKGLFQRRVGKNCMPLDPQAFAKQRVNVGAVDWSGLPADGVTETDLDLIEIERARRRLRAVEPSSPLLPMYKLEFLQALGAFRQGRVTRAGLLVFGKVELLRDLAPQHCLHYVYQPTGVDVARNEMFQGGLLSILERIEQIFEGPINPELELTVGLFKLRIPAFPISVVREAVLNAVTHRDYTEPHDVFFRHTPAELVVTSPGGFLDPITPQNILRVEPISRNRTLADIFMKLRLVERSGIGRRRIFEGVLSYGKRIPVFESDGHRVTLRIFNGGFDERMARLAEKWRQEDRELGLDGLLVLSYLKNHPFLDTGSAAGLLQLPRDWAAAVLDSLSQPDRGLVERKGGTRSATYHLTKDVARELMGKAAYTKVRGIDLIRYQEMVRAFIQHHGQITPKECRELLGLGESQSAQVTVSRYLRSWSGPDGFLDRKGKGRAVLYVARPET